MEMKTLRLLIISLSCICLNLFSVAGQNKITVDFDAPKPTLKVTKVVPLETHKETFVDQFFKVQATDRCIFVQDRFQILIFDSNGKYLSKVRNLGHGPREYVAIKDFCYHNNSLCVLPLEGQKVQLYSLAGDYLRSMSLKISADALWITDRFKAFKSTADPKGTLVVALPSGNKSIRAVKPALATTTFSIEPPRPFTQAGEQVYYLLDFIPAIYTVGTRPEDVRKTEFDFGTHTITPDYVAKLEQREMFERLKKDKMACFLNFHPTRDWWGLAFAMGEDRYCWYYHPQSGKQYISRRDNGSTSKLIVCSVDNQFVEAVEAVEFLENPRYAPYREGLQVDENDNAVLIFYTVE